ncbi:hypothetical protein [Halobacillus litoralis]|nr:hypothetical protein [Halobacillus litoralis]
MTIQFFIFTISLTRNKRQKYHSLPGYHPSAKDQWLDRKSSAFSRYL